MECTVIKKILKIEIKSLYYIYFFGCFLIYYHILMFLIQSVKSIVNVY